jgi:hypothetical protein
MLPPRSMSSPISSLKLSLFAAVVVGASSALASGGTFVPGVSVFSARSYSCASRSCQYHQFIVRLLVENRSYEKLVAAHVHMPNGSWREEPATFIESLPEGRELWEARITSNGPSCPGDVEVYGTYRQDASLAPEVSMVVPVTGCAFTSERPVVLTRQPVKSDPRGELAVKNLAYEKKLTVVYTVDGWKTVQTLAAMCAGGSADRNGFETWSFQFGHEEANAAKLEYAIAYDVAGQTFWDSNFSMNYVLRDF